MSVFQAAHIFGGRSADDVDTSLPRYLDEISFTNDDIGDGKRIQIELTEQELFRLLHDPTQREIHVEGSYQFPSEGVDGRSGYTVTGSGPQLFSGVIPAAEAAGPHLGFSEDYVQLSEIDLPETSSLVFREQVGTLDFGKVGEDPDATYYPDIPFYLEIRARLLWQPGGWMKLPRSSPGGQVYLCEFFLTLISQVVPEPGYAFATSFVGTTSTADWISEFGGEIEDWSNTVDVELGLPYPPGEFGDTPYETLTTIPIVESIAAGFATEESSWVSFSLVQIYDKASWDVRTL